MLHLNVSVGDMLIIDEGRIVINVQKKSGQEVGLGVEADRTIPVELVQKDRKSRQPWADGLTTNGSPKKATAKSLNRAQEGSTDG